MKNVFTGWAAIVLFAGCSQGLLDRYPSYELAVAKASGAVTAMAVRVEDDNVPPAFTCDCPRIFYHGSWVYYYSGRWIYWADDCWYTYPYLSVYDHDGVPFVSNGPTRSIHKGKPRGNDKTPHAAPRRIEEPDDLRLRTRPAQPRREPSQPAFRPVEARPSPKKDR
ncbi:MAG: hypothetical protein MUC50_19940 [Myxococcota bacterium]|nr:hypothetical protein [Myxococcota bacterium]